MIREIVAQDGRLLKTNADIKVEAESFFQSFLQTIPANYEGMYVDSLADLMSFSCSEEDSRWLTRVVTGEEIKKTLFAMPSDKSPGPDGYTVEFYKGAWDIIGAELIIAVQSFFAKGFLPKGLNSTILALIPKTKDAKVMRDYRPISCCNVLYKVISKVIANRLKRILPKFITGNQSAFVADKLLIENILLATELVRGYHKENISKRCAMKVDISKAFDSFQWSFLFNVLRALNLPPAFIHWISLCVTTASFSVQVNGELAGYFRSARGLCQGCSLSPYMFVICMNVLSKMLDKAAGSQDIGYHPWCKNLRLTHLCFADDLMILVDGKIISVDGIVQVLNLFAKRSGLTISMEKMTLYLGGVSPDNRELMGARYSFGLGQLPVRYLGLPLITRRLTAVDLSPLFDQIRSRVSTWTSQSLSFAGRLNLISYVLWSTTTFWMSVFWLPQASIRDLNSLCSVFLWSGPDLNTKKAKMSWSEVCKPKSEGGLGLRSLKETSDGNCLKLVWRLVSGGTSLWVQWSRMNLFKGGCFWSVKLASQSCSWMWRKLLKYRDLAQTFVKVEVNNGALTSFWYDNWSTQGYLLDKVGPRGMIDLGIRENMTLHDAWYQRRRQVHRLALLNDIEDALHQVYETRTPSQSDVILWQGKGNVYKATFSTKDTWNHIRTASNQVAWHKGVWFAHATPKYSFCTWLAVHNRLSTRDRMIAWRNGCQECNARRHGGPASEITLLGWIDKQVRAQLLAIERLGDRRYAMGLQ